MDDDNQVAAAAFFASWADEWGDDDDYPARPDQCRSADERLTEPSENNT